MTTFVTPPDLARTYKSQSYEDPWSAVEDYQRVLEYTGRHPNKGSAAVASALNLPRGRVQPWMDGGRPAPVRAIQIAEEHEWLPLDADSSVFPAFNQLAAWIFSRGSITNADFLPTFVCTTEPERDRLSQVLEAVGVPYTFSRTEQDADRVTEAKITEHSAIIGRLLSELGVPLGPRENAARLPSYLEEIPTEDQYAFAATYLENTARYWDWEDGYIIRHEDRPESYRRSLASFLTDVSDHPKAESIVVNPDSLFIPAAVVEDIQSTASVPEQLPTE